MLSHDWFGCKQVKLTGGAGHRQEDHTFGEWSEVGRARLEGIGGLYLSLPVSSSRVIAEQIGQCHRPDPSGTFVQEMSA
jgi:hypothetical protein